MSQFSRGLCDQEGCRDECSVAVHALFIGEATRRHKQVNSFKPLIRVMVRVTVEAVLFHNYLTHRGEKRRDKETHMTLF